MGCGSSRRAVMAAGCPQRLTAEKPTHRSKITVRGRQEGDMDPELTALTSTAATAVVQVLAPITSGAQRLPCRP